MSNPVEQALQTAILRKIAAYELYAATAKLVEAGPSQKMLLDLAAQERGHRRRLENVLSRGAFARLTTEQEEQVLDLKITDHLVASPLTPDATLQDILIVAGQREGNSHALYSALAQVADDPQAQRLFEVLANEELKHKQLVEKLYDELFYSDN